MRGVLLTVLQSQHSKSKAMPHSLGILDTLLPSEPRETWTLVPAVSHFIVRLAFQQEKGKRNSRVHSEE